MADGEPVRNRPAAALVPALRRPDQPDGPGGRSGHPEVDQGPGSLEATVAGESLFNDGGVVAFSILLGLVSGTQDISTLEVAKLFTTQAVGGVIFGGVARSDRLFGAALDQRAQSRGAHHIGPLMGGYALAQRLEVSGRIAMAVAGLIIGNHGRAHAMSEVTRDYVTKFWSLIDEILNAVLFLLIGPRSRGDPQS